MCQFSNYFFTTFTFNFFTDASKIKTYFWSVLDCKILVTYVYNILTFDRCACCVVRFNSLRV